ncbi:MAG: hypothetical protein ACLPKI_16655 [Streptosporangiaceae bacterium]
MRAAYPPGTRTMLLPAAAALVLSGLAAGCSSSPPAYCTAATNLKTSVHNLGDVNVAKNGLTSLQTALTKVQTNATTFATDAKSAFPSQTTALKNSLSSLETAVKSAKGQPPLTAAAAVVPAVTQVKTSASNLEGAIKSNCQ